MRAYFVLLVAAAALLTYGGATATYSTSKGEMNLTGTVESDRPTRSLRVAPSGGNGEERSWSTINGISRSKAETVRDWLTPQLNQRERTGVRQRCGDYFETGGYSP
ncbi:secreted RxLR effector peptide protein, putative [Phytophthora infestans T30-4]|uniref:RxLR effector protein n=1 Tax=Phytophthora infestans (strain T30-4) TaxID=403677 RepID=D0NXM6_PHYIT|nr:secreted RxLR effector peptide protein, putative [Phytophthora infestans T30-4]EEY67826.1 secreted RxLR effector peptide protein, putative [Phytophthora infestans T30-4]|eukprot:XP_002997851.1 secreted RxLR effector peptide protein, putative [Phytophthora infestans T30-4]